MNCVYCNDPDAHPGTRKCSDSTACELRMTRAELAEAQSELAKTEAALRGKLAGELFITTPAEYLRLEAVRDEAVALAAKYRAQLEDAVDAAVQWVVDADANNPRQVASVEAYRNAMAASAEAQYDRSKAWKAALATPVSPELEERLRAAVPS